MSSSIPTVVLTGAIGVGKTSLAEAISDILHAYGIEHALLDLDWLGQVYPAADATDPYNMKLQLANLRAVWPNFRSAGITHAVLAATLVTSKQLESLRDVLADAEITVVRVIASPLTVRERLNARDRGSLLADFLTRTEQVAADIATAGIDDLVVSNEGLSLPEVASETLHRLSWLKRDA